MSGENGAPQTKINQYMIRIHMFKQKTKSNIIFKQPTILIK